MDSYVVRIYRRAGKKSRILIGTIELAGTERKLGFSTIDELWEILRRRRSQGEPEKPHLSEPNVGPTTLAMVTRKKGMSVTGQINRVGDS